jgi:poly(hydroxyalkanoate) granule-associated protein
MSDDQGPTINVTRGSRDERHRESSSGQGSRSRPGGTALPDAMGVAAGLAGGARTAWLAGLGALSAAEEAGTRVYGSLVDQGKSWEQRRCERTGTTATRVERLRDEGARAIEVVESRVQDEVDAALRRIGAPGRDDIDALTREVDALARKVDRLADALPAEPGDDGAEAA